MLTMHGAREVSLSHGLPEATLSAPAARSAGAVGNDHTGADGISFDDQH